MQLTWVDVELDEDEPFHITPFSDIHLDSRDCDRNGFLRDYKKAAKLHNAHFCNFGDFHNVIVSSDLKRYTPSASAEGYAETDDFMNKCLDDAEDVVRTVPDAKWDIWGEGNHEFEALKRHHLNLPLAFCKRMGFRYGTYSGRVWYRIKRKGGGKDRRVFKLLYHHGAWGGKKIQGYGGAFDWAMPMGGWHVFCYGHNHYESIRPSQYWDINDQGNETLIKRLFVNTGTYNKSLSRNGQAADYAEKAGYPLATLGCPTIKVWFERTGPNHVMRLRWQAWSEGGVQ